MSRNRTSREELRVREQRRGTRASAGWFCAVCLLLLFADETVAQAAPPQWLLGKSIDLQWDLRRSFEPVHEGEGQTHTDVVDERARIYISELGRIFAKLHRHVSTSDHADWSSDASKSPDFVSKGTDWVFEGDKLHGFEKMGNDYATT